MRRLLVGRVGGRLRGVYLNGIYITVLICEVIVIIVRSEARQGYPASIVELYNEEKLSLILEGYDI